MNDYLSDEIIVMARAMSPTADFPPVNSLSTASVAPTGLDRAREMFLNIFVSQALDHVSATLEADKAAIAEAAAGYASAGVEALEHGITRLKVGLGLPPGRGA